MSLALAGAGWVTPLGSGIQAVWDRLLDGQTAPIETLQNGAAYLVRRVPADAFAGLPPHPRLRRASPISRFATAAGLAAIADAASPLDLSRTAVVFAISNGAVIYTRRFYAEIVRSGAQSASPLLFPETVFNAPASHLAAIMGVSGATYTVVGDGAVGVLALRLAADLLTDDAQEACLVVGAEEVDPLVCEAYRQWRLLRDPKKPDRGIVVSEGAGAVLLRKSPADIEIGKIDPGANFFRRSEVSAKLRDIVDRLGSHPDFCVGSANGSFIDAAEGAAIPDKLPRYSPKTALGESVGASVLWQVIAAAQALRTARLPGVEGHLHGKTALVLSCGLNQQLGGLVLHRRD